MTTRTEFLARIRAEVGRARPLFAAAVASRPREPAQQIDVVRRQLAERWPQTLEQFRREFERVGGVFHRVREVVVAADAIAVIARDRGLRRIVTWDADALGGDLAAELTRRGLEAHAMPRDLPDAEGRSRIRALVGGADLGVTGADLVIAETGSLLLVSDAGRPRSTSLLPACHVALFDRRALVESLVQVGVFLEAWHEGPVSAARGAVITLITGPSRTADIELTLTRGVHGPKEVHAVFVERAGGD